MAQNVRLVRTCEPKLHRGLLQPAEQKDSGRVRVRVRDTHTHTHTHTEEEEEEEEEEEGAKRVRVCQ